MRIFKFMIVVVLVMPLAATAEVPFHNPDLDYKCSEGFQWSRDTAACEQADCPEGAGRTYTLECNCGEAWGRPYSTCYGETPGLVVACVGADDPCPGTEPAPPPPAEPLPTEEPSSPSSTTLTDDELEAAVKNLETISATVESSCSQEQMDAFGLRVLECIGGEEVCGNYSTEHCREQEAGTDGVMAPLACFIECLAVKLSGCDDLLNEISVSCNAPSLRQTSEPLTTGEVEPPEPEQKECPGEHRVKSGYYCVCEYGYEKNDETGSCQFITSGAGLDVDSIDKINDAIAGLSEAPDGIQTVEVTTTGGKTIQIGVQANQYNVGTYRYTTDGVHFHLTLAEAVKPKFLARVGDGLLSGIRRGLSSISPFNWFSGSYGGDDRDGKYRVGRQVIYDDIDARRHPRLGTLKYANDFLRGMALYIDLRKDGKTFQQIASGDQDIDLEIEHATARMRASQRSGIKNPTEEDLAHVSAIQRKEMYEAFEDGYRRYLIYKKLGK